MKKIAEKYDLTLIETTEGENDYPRNTKYALIGFETFADAEKIAEEYGLRIEFFFKRDGWNLWKRTFNIKFHAMRPCYWYGDDDAYYDGGHVEMYFE